MHLGLDGVGRPSSNELSSNFVAEVEVRRVLILLVTMGPCRAAMVWLFPW